jgi:peroxiredoxin
MSELQVLQSRISELERAGVSVLTVSSDSREGARRAAEEQDLEFHVLRDPELHVIDAYGVRHAEAKVFGRPIARPAVFLIDEQGIVRWRFVTDNWRVRVDPDDILEAVAGL